MATKYPLTFGGLPLPLLYQGKTRETYSLPDHPFLLSMVVGDRLSTHNVVHKSSVQLKGQILTALTVFWLTQVLGNIIPNHLVAYGRRIYEFLPAGDYPSGFHLQAIIARKLQIDPVEYILRAYNAGSFAKGTRERWPKYGGKDPYGYQYPSTLPLMSEFRPPLFTPTDKSETDDERNAQEVAMRYSIEAASMRLVFDLGRRFANDRGLELVDTKGEFGVLCPEDPYRQEVERPSWPILADEVLTPDSSRYTLQTEIREGSEPPWYDKQIARDEAERVWAGGKKVPLKFPPPLLRRLTDTYHEIFFMITGQSLREFQKERME